MMRVKLLAEQLEILYADPVCNKYPQYQAHLMRNTFPKMEAWSLVHRIINKLPTNNNNTNNLVECSFRYTKEDQFSRHKAYNLPDLLSILLDGSHFYANKCVDAGNNVLESWLRNCHSKYVRQVPNIDPEEIVQIGPKSFLSLWLASPTLLHTAALHLSPERSLQTQTHCVSC